MKPNQNASASLSVQNPDKHYTFLMQTSQNCVHICKCPPYQNTTLSLSVHYIKTLHFPYQNCVHICKCPPYQNTTLSLSVHYIKTLHFPYQNCVHICKCPPFHKHYAFLMKIASIFASVHHIKTLHFPYHIFKCPLYQNTTHSL
jgi:hypothetical protein